MCEVIRLGDIGKSPSAEIGSGSAWTYKDDHAQTFDASDKTKLVYTISTQAVENTVEAFFLNEVLMNLLVFKVSY